ncbi:MAG: DUF1501 domain-containing protein [Planctomycetaceae bacterium]
MPLADDPRMLPVRRPRRRTLAALGNGLGLLAFAVLAHEERARRAGAAEGGGRAPHFAPRATRVLFLCMEGGPSHVDTFDPKPHLAADDGREVAGRRGRLLASPFAFRPRGDSGLEISDLFPETAMHADRLCLLRGMHTDLPNHAQAFIQMHCGIHRFPRPSLGAWVHYGLGSVNDNLPGFVTINPPRLLGGAANYGASFLPAIHQGTRLDGRTAAAGAEVAHLESPRRPLDAQRLQLDALADLGRGVVAETGGDAAMEGLLESYELAFRMQAELPGVLDLADESPVTLAAYGVEGRRGGAGAAAGMGPGGTGVADFGRQCLLARRLLEAGVRFVEVTAGGWDHHRDLAGSLTASCRGVDGPIAALLGDLHDRGLLDDTLVLWGGEFGRTPTAQGSGRDHNAKGFTTWMAGGGVKGGHVHGATDEHGFEAVEGRVHIHDWHATILHLLGLDHERLTWPRAGRAMRLTDTAGSVVREILA